MKFPKSFGVWFRKRIPSAVAAAVMLAAIPSPAAFAQAQASKIGPLYFASNYAYGYGNSAPAVIYSAPSTSGAGTITLYSGTVTLPDGRVMTAPWCQTPACAAFNPITIVDANAETVTPTASSGCTSAAQFGACTITATFANSHGAGARVVSGSYGLYEAASDANNNGTSAGQVIVDSGISSNASSTQINTVRGLFTGVSVWDARPNSVTAGTSVLIPASCSGTVGSATTDYLTSNEAACGTPAVQVYLAPRAGTLRNLQCSSTTGGVNSSSGVTTVYLAPLSSGTFAASAITGTFGTSTSTSDTTHTVSVVAGQAVQIRVTTQTSDTLAGIACTVQLN